MAKATLVKRDKAGRWLKGTAAPGGPGGPSPAARKALKLKAAILDATSVAQARRIFTKVAKLAEKGEPWAVKEYLRYVAGTPKHEYDPRLTMPVEDSRTSEQVTLRDQLIYLRGAADAVEAQLRAQEAEQDEEVARGH